MKTNIKNQMINQINSFMKLVLVLSMVVFSMASCQKDSDKQDELKKPDNMEHNGGSEEDSNNTQPGNPNQSINIQEALLKKIKEIDNIIGDDYTIYVTDETREVLTFLYNKKEGFFQSTSSDRLLNIAENLRNHPDKLLIYNTNKLQKHYIDKKPINILNKNEKFNSKIVEAFLKIDTKKEIKKI
jgi:hypothetical protein